MNHPDPQKMVIDTIADVQGSLDTRNLTIDKVGVKKIQHPVHVKDRSGYQQYTVATFNMYVELPENFKGTHMSRFVEILNKHERETTVRSFRAMLREISKHLDAQKGHIEMTFPFFLAQATEGNASETNATDGNASSLAEANASGATETTEQVAEVVAEPTWFELMMQEGAIGLLLEGGFFMWPLLILAIVGLAVVIERWRSLKMLGADGESLRQQVIDLLSDDKPEEALTLCENERGPVAAMLSNGLRKYLVLKKLGHDQAQIEEQVVKSMENYGVHVVAALERHLPILATISSVAPMLGFLGTVQGMIVAFSDIVEQMGEVNIVEAAASGIQVALLTTCFGLIVGIPAYLFFNYFTSVINGFVLEVEGTAAELIEVVTIRLTLDRHEEEGNLPSKPARRRTKAKRAGG